MVRTYSLLVVPGATQDGLAMTSYSEHYVVVWSYIATVSQYLSKVKVFCFSCATFHLPMIIL